MKKILTIISLVFIILFNSCSQKESTEKIEFKNKIELCITKTNTKLTSFYKDALILLKQGKPSQKLVLQYNENKANIELEKKQITELIEVDREFELKGKTLIYLNNSEKALDGFLIPIIKKLNESEPIDQHKLDETLTLFQQNVNQASELNSSIEKFCLKYKLPKMINDDFDKDVFIEKAEKMKSKNEN